MVLWGEPAVVSECDCEWLHAGVCQRDDIPSPMHTLALHASCLNRCACPSVCLQPPDITLRQ